MSEKRILVLAVIVSTLICVFSTPLGAGNSTGGERHDADNRESDSGSMLITTEVSTSSGPAMGLQERELFARCPAMGGYSSYEAQARAQARARDKARDKARDEARDEEESKVEVQRRARVRADQIALKNLGYYKGEISGFMDSPTSAAIWNFQRENGLVGGVILDSKSRRLLHGGNAKRMPDQRVKKRADPWRRLGERAQERAQVRSDQIALKKLGYYKGEINGLLDAPTSAAFWEFQRQNGLFLREFLDQKGRQLLHGGNAKRMPDQSDKKRADRRRLMEDQKELQRQGYYAGEPDGIPNPALKISIADFRKTNDLGVGARLDTRSREVLHGGAARPKSAKESGDSKQNILSYQQTLADLGYYKGAVDGILGPKTSEAIRKFEDESDVDMSNGAREALRKIHKQKKWINRANGDGVSIIIASQRGAGYRLRAANGDYIYDAEGIGKILPLIDRTLSEGKVQKVYLDVSGLSAKGVRSIKDTLLLRPESSVQLLESPNLRNLIFSRSITVTNVSPLTRHSPDRWKSTVAFSSSKTVEFFGDFIGKTKKLTSESVGWMRQAFSGRRTKKITLAGSLHQMRKDLIKSGDIKSEDDLRTQLRDQFDETIELMSLPTGETVRVAWRE